MSLHMLAHNLKWVISRLGIAGAMESVSLARA